MKVDRSSGVENGPRTLRASVGLEVFRHVVIQRNGSMGLGLSCRELEACGVSSDDVHSHPSIANITVRTAGAGMGSRDLGAVSVRRCVVLRLLHHLAGPGALRSTRPSVPPFS